MTKWGNEEKAKWWTEETKKRRNEGTKKRGNEEMDNCKKRRNGKGWTGENEKLKSEITLIQSENILKYNKLILETDEIKQISKNSKEDYKKQTQILLNKLNSKDSQIKSLKKTIKEINKNNS